MNTTVLQQLLLNLSHQWRAFADAPRQNLSDYEQGFVAGFEAAAQELDILVAQILGLPLPEPIEDDFELEIVSPPTEKNEAEWEYLYVRFEQNAEGGWYLKDVNGFWHSPWKTTLTFAEAVEQLRNHEGWRLVSFAKGIHVFRRPHR